MTATPHDAHVTHFLDLIAAGDLDRAIDLLDEQVVYTNVSLPTVRGRERVRKLAHATLGRQGVGFEVTVHNAAVHDGVVLNERTDALTVGRLRVQFWVFGRFEIRDQKITVWRDSFDWTNLTIALLRGLLGIALPTLGATPPSQSSRPLSAASASAR